METTDIKFYVFGSFLKQSNYNDIDVLVVIPTIENIQMANEHIMEISNQNIGNIVHIQIYSNSEFYNEENKFSYKNVQHEISKYEFIDLYKIRPTTAST